MHHFERTVKQEEQSSDEQDNDNEDHVHAHPVLVDSEQDIPIMRCRGEGLLSCY
jgi:hypothetical protein